MTLGALLRRLSRHGSRATGLVSTIALVWLAAGSFGTAAAAAPYPPTSTCALSWSQSGPQNAESSTLIGSGYDSSQPVAVMLYPQARTLGSYVTNSTGAFEVAVDVSTNAESSWVTATTATRTCSVAPPAGNAPGQPGGSATVPPGGSTGTSVPGGGSAGNGGSSTSAGNGTGGAAPGGTGGSSGGTSGNGTGSSDSAYPPSGTSAAPTAGTSSPTSAPVGTAPSPTGRPTSTISPNADKNLPSALGLPLSAILTIAVLLVLAGSLAVLFLTRRSS